MWIWCGEGKLCVHLRYFVYIRSSIGFESNYLLFYFDQEIKVRSVGVGVNWSWPINVLVGLDLVSITGCTHVSTIEIWREGKRLVYLPPPQDTSLTRPPPPPASLCVLGSGFRIRIHLIRIRIQHFRLNTDPDPGFLWPKNWKKFTAENFYFISKTIIYLSLGLHKGRPSYKKAFSSQKRTSSNSNHEITYFFLLLWVIFALLDPDPVPNTDPDPLIWLNSVPIRFRYPGWIGSGFPPRSYFNI